MRILWLSSAPWTPTHYGNQTALFTRELRAAGHDLTIVGTSGISRGQVEWHGIPVLPMPLSMTIDSALIVKHYEHCRADLIISLHHLQDTVDGSALRKERPDILWGLWFPIDCEPLPHSFYPILNASSFRLTLSRFGERVAGDAGFSIRYIPYGINTTIFQPRCRAQARKELEWPADVFISGMVAKNSGVSPAFQQNISGFARFHRKHPDSLLYLHTIAISEDGLNLESVCTREGLKIGKDVFFCDPYRHFIGIPATEMVSIYNAIDVLQMASMGDGFGLPLIEAQSCGTPVITGDWSATSELCFSGWKVTKQESKTWCQPPGGKWRLPSPDAIADRLEQAYITGKDVKRMAQMREPARQGALAHDVKTVVAQYWLPLLAEIA